MIIKLENILAFGDNVACTPAIKDLHLNYPGEYKTLIHSGFKEVYENNPYITDRANQIDRKITLSYKEYLSGEYRNSIHFTHAYRLNLQEQIGREIVPYTNTPTLYLSKEEKRVKEDWNNYWVIDSGGKYDMTTKWWDYTNYQAVVDYFKGKIQFIQLGALQHYHPRLDGVVSLIGKTTIRDVIRIIHNSNGVLCPITSYMHVAAAFNKPNVVVAGGREDYQWEKYPNQKYLHTVGLLECCKEKGCWKSNTIEIPHHKTDSYCENPILVRNNVYTPKCMSIITPNHVIKAIESFI